jgi:hypothetical protein
MLDVQTDSATTRPARKTFLHGCHTGELLKRASVRRAAVAGADSRRDSPGCRQEASKQTATTAAHFSARVRTFMNMEISSQGRRSP